MRNRMIATLGLVLAAALADAQEADKPAIADGPFKGEMESLKQYQCPDWFRDAKFGIWAHWGPQAVPMMGDWYAKHMYVPGHPQYKHHLETYGPPSEHGYKDIIALWKAEKFDPERLMALYKKAGARYFVSMGSHHDNFFLWDSKIHRWNAAAMGPKRDIVGDWQKAAKKNGLRFGVSEHLGASFTWFQPSHGSDKTGPKAGIPYDGADPKLQDLYHFPAEAGDKAWYSSNPRWHRMWFDRIKELVDLYRPDLLYTDGGVPFGATGLSLVAHYYNSSARGGAADAIYTCKQKSEGRWIEDLERGVMPRINPDPWQTDTSIGDWYYNRNWKFRPVSWTIHMLADIVSKNGNLLLNVVQRPDGSLDPEVEQALEELAAWIAIHGEAIYDTRPWLVYGEGRVRAKGGHFKEDFAYTAQDIRFTTKGAALYAVALGWPADGRLVVRSLAKTAEGGAVTGVSLLGYDGKVEWTQTPEGLVVTLPEKKVSPYTCGLKIAGTGLKPAPVEAAVEPLRADAKGAFTLGADDAELHGDQIKAESQGGKSNIGFWDKPGEWVSWKVRFEKPGAWQVTAEIAGLAVSEFVVESGDQKLPGTSPVTGAWDKFEKVAVGRIEAKQAGVVEVKMRPKDAASWKAINLRGLRLTPAP
jgi:alpha-L-fucosidase